MPRPTHAHDHVHFLTRAPQRIKPHFTAEEVAGFVDFPGVDRPHEQVGLSAGRWEVASALWVVASRLQHRVCLRVVKVAVPVR